MPQRTPLSPSLLVSACTLAAVPAAWLALAAETLLGGLIGAALGFGWPGVSLSPTFTLAASRPWSGTHPPLLWAVVLLAGPAGAALLGLALHAAVQMFRAAAWVRVLALEWTAFAGLRLPALLVAAVLPGGRGPADRLYRTLGEPQSGRWAVALLALLALWGVGALVSRLAVGAGREWMRVDGHAFRRHLVRVVAGYPSLVALAGWSAMAPWAWWPWMAGWLVLTLAAQHALTS